VELREILLEHQEHERQESCLAGGASPVLSTEQRNQGCLKRRRQESQEELPAALRTVIAMVGSPSCIWGDGGEGNALTFPRRFSPPANKSSLPFSEQRCEIPSPTKGPGFAEAPGTSSGGEQSEQKRSAPSGNEETASTSSLAPPVAAAAPTASYAHLIHSGAQLVLDVLIAKVPGREITSFFILTPLPPRCVSGLAMRYPVWVGVSVYLSVYPWGGTLTFEEITMFPR
jgi:hypothetical protein